ncbi:HAD-IA family hydrolase [Saccharibacillus sp. JS10]|uniref:HAD-IA family hydrolase n=1 Tax=Saccharibacillus sp. JS10 TaxID=2950552 RepID=UPI00210AA66A|nr:HAD-IA family hydrolase [Saccharibacillus sp. JS10]MCQ4085528.1 HAD-IA family hydrolase [Saccharibacillus sp. JS10]
MIRHIIFDFDGTIVNSRPLIVELYNRLAAKHGYNAIREDESEPFAGRSIRERSKSLGIPMYRLPLLGFQLFSEYRRQIKTLEIKDGVGDLIRDLNAQGYELSIISSNLESNIRSFLQHNEISQFVQVRSCFSLFGKHRAIHSFLRDNKLNRHEALYIGDELRDIQAGQRSGIKIIAAGWGYDSSEIMNRLSPDFTALYPGEVPAAIRGFNAGLI